MEPAFTGTERLALAGFYRYAVEEGLLEHSPVAHAGEALQALLSFNQAWSLSARFW